MKALFFIFFVTLSCVLTHGQSDTSDIKDAVMIGNIDMSSVIIHVYKSKEDIYPFKEFILMTDKETGKRQAVSSTIYGKSSKGGFIIVNGIKAKDEIASMLAGDKVYDEIVLRDVEISKEDEQIIDDFIKQSILDEEKESKDKINEQEEVAVAISPKQEQVNNESEELDKLDLKTETKAIESEESNELGKPDELKDTSAPKEASKSTISTTKTTQTSIKKPTQKKKSSYSKPKSKSKRTRIKMNSKKKLNKKQKGGRNRTNCYSF